MTTHWLTRYDPDDGEPYGDICDCEVGADHDGEGELNGPAMWAESTQESAP